MYTCMLQLAMIFMHAMHTGGTSAHFPARPSARVLDSNAPSAQLYLQQKYPCAVFIDLVIADDHVL